MLAADGYLLGTTANFGYMSGALKHFFDTIFLEAGGALADDGSAAAGRRAARSRSGCGCTGATTRPARSARSQSIVGALPVAQAAEVLEVLGDVAEAHAAAAYELGGTLAALLSAYERRPRCPSRAVRGVRRR